jgi:DNA invertase Pin-like site-specific DNA recombinase
MKVAIYARVSTDDKGQDPLNQLLELREFATRQGWTVVREYTDEATAKNGERTGFQQMWADVAKHRFDLLLFWSLDRLTREGTYKTLTYLRRLTDTGVKFKSYTEQYIDSQADTIGSRITAGVAGTFIPDVKKRGRTKCRFIAFS